MTVPSSSADPAPAGPAGSASPARVGAGADGWRLAVVTAELVLAVALIREFQIGSIAFGRLAAVAAAGFVVHHLLPMRFRMPFFAALSLAGIAIVFGIRDAAVLIGIGLVLIGLCHAPIAFRSRVVLLVVAGGALIACRQEWIPVPVSTAVWPILGSMFMFRIIVYLYDLRHRAAPFGPWRALSYFFLLPNVCFPLFPVVDYKTFCRTYYNDVSWRVYQVGLTWMLRGIVQLIMYRLVYHYLLEDPSQITSAGGVFRYMVSTYLLYLRVSGDFHLIVGLLHLFGFNLSETHHLYLLSSSFNDFWRRINIYWKDFMMKVVYMPAFFRLKRTGATRAMVLATLLTFGVTWMAHSYQWFWLRGRFPITPQDALFWSVLGGLVVVNSLWEARRGSRRGLSRPGLSMGRALGVAGRTVGTFVVILTLWSVWNEESFSGWFSLMSRAGNASGLEIAAILGVLLAIAAGGVVMGHSPSARTEGGAAAPAARGFVFWRSAAVVASVSAAMLAVSSPWATARIDPAAAAVIDKVKTSRLNARDAARLMRGYYEDLTDVTRFNSQLWQVFMGRPPGWVPIQDTEAARRTDDFLQVELLPSRRIEFKGKVFTTNRWGMRDQEYAKEKPPGTYRIVLMGTSNTMGSGVSDGETFEAIVEDRLNREAAGRAFERYEILNLSTGGYGAFQKLRAIESRGFEFDPDAVLFVSTNGEPARTMQHLRTVVREGREVPYEFLSRLIETAGVGPRTPEVVVTRRLGPRMTDMTRWVYGRLADECRRRGIRPAVVFLPLLGQSPGQNERRAEEVRRLAARAGIPAVLDLNGAYGETPESELILAEWDQHQNARGHRLLADRLWEALRDGDPLGLFGGDDTELPLE